MRFSITRLLSALALTACFTTADAQNYVNIRDLDVSDKGDTVITGKIQKAIDSVAALGGGTVYFPPGKYLTAMLTLKSNITIFIDNGATILASRRPGDYKFTTGIYTTESDVPVLFYSDGADKVTFTGGGTVDGQAQHTWEMMKEMDNYIKEETENAQRSGIEMKRAYAVEPKVRLFYMINGKDLRFNDLSIINSPNWTLHVGNCERVFMRGLYIFSSLDKGVNADGIDVDGCRYVQISDCTVITGDDAICLKSTTKNGKSYNCENITVTNCNLTSTSTALKIGTESHGDFKNIVFSNSTISNSNRGIGIFVRDGATVDKVIFSNLTIDCKRKHFNWWGDGDPIHFVLQRRKTESRLGFIQNILVENVIATGQGTSLIAGYADRNLKNITLKNVEMNLGGEELADKRASSNLMIKNVDNLRIEGCRLGWDITKSTEPKWDFGLNIANCNEVVINTSTVIPAPGKTNQAILVDNVTNGVFFAGKYKNGYNTVLQRNCKITVAE